MLRLSHVDITVPDLDLAVAYYTGVMGMIEVERTSDRVFFKCWDEIDHHSLAVRYDPRVGIDHFTFKVEKEDDLAELESKLERWGTHIHRAADGDEIGQGQSIRFDTPSGHSMELVHEVEKVGGLLPTTNPPSLPEGPLGIAPPRIDHILLTAEEVPEATVSTQTCSAFASPSNCSTAMVTRSVSDRSPPRVGGAHWWDGDRARHIADRP